jgi:hypothetical protein
LAKRSSGSDKSSKGAAPGGIYVYCVVKNPSQRTSFGNIGFDNAEVIPLEYKDFSPIISEAPMREYAVDEADVEVHTKVVHEVMKDHDVLPVAYGMIFKNKKLLTVAMSAGYEAMKKGYGVVSGNVELGIKVFQPKEVEFNDAASCRSEFLEALKAAAFDTKELKLFSERLIFNAAFLVERQKVEEFSALVGDLSAKYDALKTQYSGPWPPYNFVDIHILGKKKKGWR